MRGLVLKRFLCIAEADEVVWRIDAGYGGDTEHLYTGVCNHVCVNAANHGYSL